MTTQINEHITLEQLQEWVVDHSGEYNVQAEFTGKKRNGKYKADEYHFTIKCPTEPDEYAKVRFLKAGVKLMMAHKGEWIVIDTVTYKEMDL